MRLDGAIFPVEQRSVGGCLDLAIVFLREHFLGVLRLLACFAIPSVALTWWLMVHHDWTLFGCVVLFVLQCPFCGAALVAASGRRLFGDRFSVRNGLKALLRRIILITLLFGLVRVITFLGLWFLLIPGYMIATRYGFLSEILLLEGTPGRRYETRLSDLMNDTFRGLLGNLIALMLLFGIMVSSLFVLTDMASGTLFGFPILAGRVSGFAYMVEEIMTLLTRDPRVGTVLVAVMWLVYPITRLAWMFCYLDVRIRKEGWDVELNFRVEARRLESPT